MFGSVLAEIQHNHVWKKSSFKINIIIQEADIDYHDICIKAIFRRNFIVIHMSLSYFDYWLRAQGGKLLDTDISHFHFPRFQF
jgi:hypothetical protein